MSAARWDRVAAAITEGAGLTDVKVNSRAYQEMVYGRARFGTSYGIDYRLPSGDHVQVRDCWWRKNPDYWIGYQVELCDREGMIRRTWPLTKKRGEVVAAVCEAVLLVSGGKS